jgi:glutaredoxin
MLKEIHKIKSEVTDRISVIKEISIHNKTEQTELLSDISKLIQKMGGSSEKGKISEQTVLQLLYTLYPSASIINVTKQKESGDIILQRLEKYDIMIENKIYNHSVDDKEVLNFLRDGRKNNISGIMLSQQHGISNKKNYQIDIMDNNVYVYVHQVFHDPNKIKIAVDIIDTLKKQLDLIVKDKNISMDKEVLDKINKEYNEIIIIKTNQQMLLEEYNKNMNKLIESIKLPNLGDFLTQNGGTIHINHEFKCEFCNKVLASNVGLNNHKRTCQKQQAVTIN